MVLVRFNRFDVEDSMDTGKERWETEGTQKNQGHSERGKQRSSQDAVCRNRDTIQKEGAGREQKGVSKIGKGQRIRDEGRS
jgi:hypothetical protein